MSRIEERDEDENESVDVIRYIKAKKMIDGVNANKEDIKNTLKDVENYAKMDEENMRKHLIDLLTKNSGIDASILQKMDNLSLADMFENKKILKYTTDILKNISRDIYDLFDNITIEIDDDFVKKFSIILFKNYENGVRAELRINPSNPNKLITLALISRTRQVVISNFSPENLNYAITKFVASHLKELDLEKTRKELGLGSADSSNPKVINGEKDSTKQA